MRQLCICVVYAVVIWSSAHAQTREVIRLYDDTCGAVKGIDYSINDQAKTIKILSGIASTPACRFKFESVEEMWDEQTQCWNIVGPKPINKIWADNPNIGTVWIQINGDPTQVCSDPHIFGASDVKEFDFPLQIDLNLFWLRISGSLGQEGMGFFDEIGLVQVGGDLHIGLFAGDITSQVTIDGNMYGNIEGDVLSSIWIKGAGPHTGTIKSKVQNFSDSITLGGPMEGDLIFNNSMNGTIVIQGDMSGSLEIKNVMAGTVTINGDLKNSGNRVQIIKCNGGTFTCQDMDITFDEPALGFQLGDTGQRDTYEHKGTIDMNGALRGVMIISGKSGMTIEMNELDAPYVPRILAYGGIGCYAGYTDLSNITIKGDFKEGQLRYHNTGPSSTVDWKGTVTIDGDMGGFDDDNDGTLELAEIRTWMRTSSGKNGKKNDMYAKIWIHGDVTGNEIFDKIPGEDPRSVPAVWVFGKFNGKVLIDGSLIDGPVPNDPEIVGDSWGTPPSVYPAIAVDYDGWDSADSWQAGATAKVGTTTYTGNTPAEKRVWDISKCRGDMNNDGMVNIADVTPFDDALNNTPKYEQDYPGLGNKDEGSMVFHGDCNCDLSFDIADTAPFTYLVLTECCLDRCDFTCATPEGLSVDPILVGSTMRIGLPEESRAGFGNGLIDYTAELKNPAEIEYWTEVLVEFEKK